jgi:hypothetical protein
VPPRSAAAAGVELHDLGDTLASDPALGGAHDIAPPVDRDRAAVPNRRSDAHLPRIGRGQRDGDERGGES